MGRAAYSEAEPGLLLRAEAVGLGPVSSPAAEALSGPSQALGLPPEGAPARRPHA